MKIKRQLAIDPHLFTTTHTSVHRLRTPQERPFTTAATTTVTSPVRATLPISAMNKALKRVDANTHTQFRFPGSPAAAKAAAELALAKQYVPVLKQRV